jgi:hypothetical protein
MSLDLLIGPLVTIAALLAFAWRIVSAIVRSHHWSLWYAAAAVAVIVLGIIVVGLLLELAAELHRRRYSRDKIVMQHRYLFCHVKRLSTGRWFLTDRATGREYRPEGEVGHNMNIGKTRNVADLLPSFGPEPQTAGIENDGRNWKLVLR